MVTLEVRRRFFTLAGTGVTLEKPLLLAAGIWSTTLLKDTVAADFSLVPVVPLPPAASWPVAAAADEVDVAAVVRIPGLGNAAPVAAVAATADEPVPPVPVPPPLGFGEGSAWGRGATSS